MNKIQYFRELRNLTQNELAEKSGLSIRTIQRMESGNVPKGHTLKMICKALNIEFNDLLENRKSKNSEPKNELDKLKLLNTSIITFLIIPYGNLIFPSIIYFKNKERNFRKTASQILNFQIFWTIVTSVFLILTPFVQKQFEIETALIIWVLLFWFIINIAVFIVNANSLNKNSTLKISSPIQFL